MPRQFPIVDGQGYEPYTRTAQLKLARTNSAMSAAEEPAENIRFQKRRN
jgi:hypothetical protein